LCVAVVGYVVQTSPTLSFDISCPLSTDQNVVHPQVMANSSREAFPELWDARFPPAIALSAETAASSQGFHPTPMINQHIGRVQAEMLEQQLQASLAALRACSHTHQFGFFLVCVCS